ncbi:helix-turn-helix transcriptional regulator [Streptosporangium sp. NPDC051023]|uniref:helix-turn-helix domain-containing protein n=1 Tax=Streptosporangium sp. NPDC051023 TaxID=3155410 RepID=UPI00344FA2D0
MPYASKPARPDVSPWHLLGVCILHWRDEVRHLTQRELAKAALVDQGELSRWERGLGRPHPDHIRGIDNALGAGGQLIALRALIAEIDEIRKSRKDTNPPSRNEDDVERRAFLQFLTVLGAGSGISASAVDALHSGLRQLTGHAADNSADDWEQIAWDYAQGVWTEPPGSRVTDLAGDIRDLDQALSRPRTSAEHATLLRVYAQLAAFLALDLAEVSSIRAGWRSWRAARAAADASGDRDLRVWVRSFEADQWFYLRRVGPALDTLLDEAVQLADGHPSRGLTQALRTRGLVLAERGQANLSRSAFQDLKDVYERLPSSVTGDHISAWGVSLGSIQYAEALSLTKLGDARAAMPMLDQALAAVPPEKAGGRANLGLIQAWGLIREHEVTEGLDHALDVTSALPITVARRRIAGELLASLPQQARSLPAARDFHALVTAERPA